MPTKDGYNFKGYYTAPTGGEELSTILNGNGITQNTTLYAQWEEIYNVKFDANGGKFTGLNNDTTLYLKWINSKYNYDELIKPTRDGYTFAGFFTEQINGTNLKTLMQGNGITQDTTLYAQWKKNVDKIKIILTPDVIDIDDYFLNLPNEKYDAFNLCVKKGIWTKDYDSNYMAFNNQLGKYLFSFTRSHSIDINPQVTADDNERFTLTEDDKKSWAEDEESNFIPNYVEIIFCYYKVTFDANGGKFTNLNNATTFTNSKWLNSEYDYDKIEKPERDGYKFKGFCLEKNGGADLRGMMEGVGITKDITLYAQWEENSVADTLTSEPENNNQQTSAPAQTSQNVQASLNNPKTGDNLILYTIISMISILGIIVITKLKKSI